MIDPDDDYGPPTYVDEHGIVRVPVQYRRIRNRDDRIAALTLHAFDCARYRAQRGR